LNHLRDYHIQFVGLEPGTHEFEFEVNDSFFEHFDYSLIRHGHVNVKVAMDKSERMMIYSIHLEGEVLVTCDRCTDEFLMPVSDTQKLIVKLGAEYFEESEDVVVIPDTDYQFDLSTYIYEFIHLALPPRLLHPDDENGNSTCNPEILKILESLSVPEENTDPRWEALKNLKSDQ
jgi:uncharacterized protein